MWLQWENYYVNLNTIKSCLLCLCLSDQKFYHAWVWNGTGMKLPYPSCHNLVPPAVHLGCHSNRTICFTSCSSLHFVVFQCNFALFAPNVHFYTFSFVKWELWPIYLNTCMIILSLTSYTEAGHHPLILYFFIFFLWCMLAVSACSSVTVSHRINELLRAVCSDTVQVCEVRAHQSDTAQRVLAQRAAKSGLHSMLDHYMTSQTAEISVTKSTEWALTDLREKKQEKRESWDILFNESLSWQMCHETLIHNRKQIFSGQEL